LDLGLRDGDGIDVCRQLHRRRPDCAILILTARRKEIDVVVVLDAATRDYIVKTVSD
jgi:DNA-binding response OmpR family regulator